MSEVGTSGWTFPSDVTLTSGAAWTEGNPSWAVVYKSNVSISDATWTTISWTGEYYDTDNYWTSGDPTVITIPESGYYDLSLYIYRSQRTDFRLNAVTHYVDGGGGRIISRYGTRTTDNGGPYANVITGLWGIEANAGWEVTVDYYQDNTANAAVTCNFNLGITRVSGYHE